MGLIFEEPPARGELSEVDWAAAGAEMKERPDEWARVAVYRTSVTAAQVAYQINQGRKHPTLHAHGRFEARARCVDGEFRVYARYIGPAGSTTENGEPRDG